MLNPVIVSYIKIAQGIPQTGDHFFIGDGQSISNYHKNAGLAVVKNFKKSFERCMKEGFELPTFKDFLKNREQGGPGQAHRIMHTPPETSWAELADMNKSTLISFSRESLAHSLIRSDVSKNASIEEINSSWENWSSSMTAQLDNKRIKDNEPH